MPFAALPGRRPGTVLLEDVAVAVVPHGPFLLDRLTSPPPVRAGRGTMLLAGAVDYGPAGAWRPLDGTRAEVAHVRDLAARCGAAEVRLRLGADATAAGVAADLPGARFAHLATHGFYRDGGPARSAAAVRNPLLASGLVLAGANAPGPDRGVLTAEAIAAHRLEGMDLAVLSACETSLGDVVAGEGVFGLQRAFHAAGCWTVVASLWRVDDTATAELMHGFYRHLWEAVPPRPPIQALRAAQLAMLRGLHPGSGVGRDVALRPVPAPPPPAVVRPAGSDPPTRTHLWAAFVVSGAPH